MCKRASCGEREKSSSRWKRESPNSKLQSQGRIHPRAESDKTTKHTEVFMPIATILSRAQHGMDAPQVRVEVDVAKGLPAFALVGLPETVVKESKDRVRAAILNSNFEFPSGKITVNLAPADLPKEGGRFDLPIAVGILIASEQLLVQQNLK